MNDLLKKRFREIIRKHYEDHYTRSFERTKDMYVTIALVDAILDEVTVDDLVPVQRMDYVKMLDQLMGELLSKSKTSLIGSTTVYPFVLSTGETVNMIVTFEKS